MLKKTEASIWRMVAVVIIVILAVCIVANTMRKDAVPHQITLLLFGCLVAIGVGNSIVNPNTSRTVLSDHEETRFRRRQYTVGLVFSVIFALLLVLTELRESLLVWLFAPIITLPFGLVVREHIIRD